MQQHREAGGRLAFVKDKLLVLATGNTIECQVPMADIPITRQGRVAFMTENALASAAAAWGLGVSFADIAPACKASAASRTWCRAGSTSCRWAGRR